MYSDTSGYVYILSNEAMPGILKIGHSMYGGRKRAKEIYSQGGTGIPMPFKMEFEIWSNDCHCHEQYIHEQLINLRINKSREFFRIEVDRAIEVIMSIVGADYNLVTGVSDMTVTEYDIMAGYDARSSELINELFPGIPHELILKSAITYHLEQPDINRAISVYKGACELRKARLSSRIEESSSK